MSANESRSEQIGDVAADRALRFWATLLVATLIVGFTAYVLSFALLAPGQSASAHRAASSLFIVAS